MEDPAGKRASTLSRGKGEGEREKGKGVLVEKNRSMLPLAFEKKIQ